MNKQIKYILLIFLVSFNLRLGIASVPPILAQIKNSLELTNLEASLLTSIPVVCMGVLAFFVSSIQQKLGRKYGVFIFLILLGFSISGRAFAANYYLLILTAFLIGFAIAIIGPLLSGFIKEEFPNKSGLLIGFYSLGMGLGAVCASSFMILITNFFDGSWQYSLAVWGIFAVITALLWLFFVPTQQEHSLKEKEQSETVRTHLKNPKLWQMILFFGIQSGIFYSITTWIPDFLLHKGLTPTASALQLTLFTAVQMTFSFIIPTMMDRFGRLGQWLTGCCLFMFGAVLLFLFCNGEFFMTIGTILTAISLGGLFPIAMLLPLQSSSNAVEASIWTSLVQAFGYIIGGIIPSIIGLLVDQSGSYSFLFWFVAAGTILLLLTGLKDGKQRVTAHE
ncbi:CynX/NimT family MFS transporter [Enterococcus sp. LJL51]|uniref:MFS transporter n=1 Tax=Enterococcus sp. LJL51 TaxID=3416656 RepID=UPI003CF06A0A